MNFIRKMRKLQHNAKALSPVVASIILIAVTVAVSIAVAMWMGSLSNGFMETEQLSVRSVSFNGAASPYYTISVYNTGAKAVVLSSVQVNGNTIPVASTVYNGTSAATYTLPANSLVTVTITTNSPLVVSGNTYEVKIVTAKGNAFPYTATAPA